MISVSVLVLCGIIYGIIVGDAVGQERCENIRSPCPCENSANGPRMNCVAGRRRTVIPNGFPVSTYVINLQSNRVSQVNTRQFDGLDKLVLLRLDNNNITEVQSKAFHRLPSLDDLHLSGNEIIHIPDDILDQVSPLSKGVKLDNNNIETFPLNLLLRSGKILSVNNNPIRCDCFAIIPQALKRKAFGTCSSPPGLKGRLISSIQPPDVACQQCSSKDCNQKGSCYLKDGVPSCLCFTGYSGESCQIQDDNATGPIEPTPVGMPPNQSPSTKTTIKPATSLTEDTKGGSSSKLQTTHILIIVACVFILVLLVLLVLFLLKQNKHKRRKSKRESTSSKSSESTNAVDFTSNIYEEIKRPLPELPDNSTKRYELNAMHDNEAMSMESQESLDYILPTLQQQQECCYEIEPDSEDAYMSFQEVINPYLSPAATTTTNFTSYEVSPKEAGLDTTNTLIQSSNHSKESLP